MKRVILYLLLLLPLSLSAQQSTLKQQMETLRKEKNINFVYDSSLEQLLKQPSNKTPKDKNLKEALKDLFEDTGIEWQQQGRYVTLRRQKEQTSAPRKQSATQRRHTIS